MIKIIYFGALQDLLGKKCESLAWNFGTTDDLLKMLRTFNQTYNDALAPHNIFRLAVNERIIYEQVNLQKGDEVAILPPVTGG